MTQPNAIAVRVFLLLAWAGWCRADVSVNVPLDHWAYAELDWLTGQGLLQSDMMTTRPVSRLEMARLISEARQNLETASQENHLSDPLLTDRILGRLEHEFREDVAQVQAPRGLEGPGLLFKPVEDPTVRWIHGRRPFALENRFGDQFQAGTNRRFRLVSRGTLQNWGAFYLRPELEEPSPRASRSELVAGYGKVQWGPVEIELGKDALWWGPGRHGALLLTNNAENLTLLKLSNPTPVLLPGPLHRLGPFKAVVFLSELEAQRVVPHPKFMGVRLSAKPHPRLEIGGSRTILFGGQGLAPLDIEDYLQIFYPKNLQGEENQLASFDVSWRTDLPTVLPARSARLYVEYGGEDAAGFHQYRPLLGVTLHDLFRTGRTDLRFEYTKTHVGRFATTFYNHSLFQTGYTYRGNVMGHHVGTNARDLYAGLRHYLTADVILQAGFDRQDTAINGLRQKTYQIDLGLTWFTRWGWQVQTFYRYQETRGKAFDGISSNQIFDFGLTFDF